MHWFKGSVQRKLRPRLLYIVQKLFSRKWSNENKILIFFKGTLYNWNKTPSADLAQPRNFCLQNYFKFLKKSKSVKNTTVLWFQSYYKSVYLKKNPCSLYCAVYNMYTVHRYRYVLWASHVHYSTYSCTSQIDEHRTNPLNGPQQPLKNSQSILTCWQIHSWLQIHWPLRSHLSLLRPTFSGN